MRGRGKGGRKGFDNLFVGFSEPFVGGVLKLGLLSDVFFGFSILSLSVGLVGNLVHAPCVLCMLGRWAMSAVDYLGTMAECWRWPISICCISFFSGERQSTLKSPQTGTTGTILPESILMRKMSLFGLFTGCRQRVINRNKAEPQTALSWQSPIPSSMATSQKLHQRVLSQLTFYFLHTVALPMITWSGRDG